ncbi:MAG: STAS domain-containing protein [Jiangellaceae bacterium]
MSDGLRFRAQDVGGCIICRVTGEVDLVSAATLHEHLLAQLDDDHPLLVVDLAGVGFMDSSALAALVAAHRQAEKFGGGVRLAGAHGAARKVLEVSQIDVVLDHHDDVGDAVEAALAARDGEPS